MHRDMSSAATALTWEERLAFVESSRHRVSYEALDLAPADPGNGTASKAEVNAVQLAAYCEAVKRLTAQGIEEKDSAQILQRCGGDIDAAEVFAGVCASVGLFSMLDEDLSESWCWEGEADHLHFASSLQEVVHSMRTTSTYSTSDLSAVASAIESTANAVTEDMRQEVICLEAARQQSCKACSIGALSVDAIRARFEAGYSTSRPKITAVHEVLNPMLWRSYSIEKQFMAEPKEAWLFHGSGPENIAHICLEGFDLKLANPKGSCGAGIYFAPNSSNSRTYTQKEPLKSMHSLAPKYDNQSELLATARVNGLQAMLLCRVLLGRVGSYNGGSQAPAGYDSVQSLNMKVVYRTEQVYPCYVVFFEP